MAAEKPSRMDQRRAQFARYKSDVKARGKPFYPYAMVEDTLMSLVVVAVIIGLAVLWKWTSWSPHHDGTHQGLLGPEYTPKADPGTTSFVPRPDWYFYFLFYLLRIFKWPDTVFLGTIGIPTLCLMLLIAIPFIDVRPERRILRRPVALIASILVVLSMGYLTYLGATAKEPLGSEILGHVPAWSVTQGFASNKPAIAGAKLFAVSGCLTCHTYLSDGGHQLGAPELTAEGAKNKGIAFEIAHLKCPSCVNRGSPMPSFSGLGDTRLQQIAAFLVASKGPVKH
jgi:menaquinol-cytochrome c reductase cytochrome b/c subunit